jgi:tryptophan synthase alpha chain
MNRITQLFNTGKRGILSVYFTAGFPRIDDTVSILHALQARGVDMAEIGIPFADPMADGPVIQDASARALRNGMTLRRIFEQLEDVRQTVSMPLILMGYLNPIMQFGFEEFCRSCSGIVDGVIIPDLPFEVYMKGYKPVAYRFDIKIIMLITPETSDERIRLIDANTGGFIYMVSSAAITGAQESFDDARRSYFRRVADMNLRNPRLVGFGISNKATFDDASAHSHGAIVGSRFIQHLATTPNIEDAVDALLATLRP